MINDVLTVACVLAQIAEPPEPDYAALAPRPKGKWVAFVAADGMVEEAFFPEEEQPQHSVVGLQEEGPVPVVAAAEAERGYTYAPPAAAPSSSPLLVGHDYVLPSNDVSGEDGGGGAKRGYGFCLIMNRLICISARIPPPRSLVSPTTHSPPCSCSRGPSARPCPS